MRRVTLLLLLPLFVSSTLLALFSLNAFSDGKNFVAGFHFAKWFVQLGLAACVYFPCLLIAVVVGVRARHKILHSLWLRLVMWICILGLSVPCFSFRIISTCFSAGRIAAYDALDCRATYDACLELSMKLPASESVSVFAKSGEIQALPQAIAQLAPLEVAATKHAVEIRMDGGGPMTHEGIAVLLCEELASIVGQNSELRPLDDKLPVFLYRLPYGLMQLVEEVKKQKPR